MKPLTPLQAYMHRAPPELVILHRDGIEAHNRYCRQAYAAYRKHLKTRGLVNRREIVRACVRLRQELGLRRTP